MAENNISIKVQADVNGAKAALRDLQRQVQESGRTQTQADREALASAKARVRETNAVARAERDLGILGVRSQREIKTEMDKVSAALDKLKRNSKAAGSDIARAAEAAKEKMSALKAEMDGGVKAADKLRESWGKLAALAGSLAIFGVAAKQAIEFEDALVDVRRAANTTAEETEELGGQFKDLARQLGMSASAVAKLAAEAAKTGIAKGDLVEFARVAATAAMNFDMMPEEAGEALAGLRKILRIGIGDMEGFVGAMNLLADNAATKERAIIETLTRAGGSASSFGLNAKQAAALATALLNVKATSETAGTAIRTLTTRLTLGRSGTGKFGSALKAIVGDVDAFARLMQQDATKAIETFLRAVNKMPVTARDFQLNELFGEGLDTDNIKKLANDVDEFGRIMGLAATDGDVLVKTLRDLTALKLGTTASEIKLMNQAWANAGESLGKIFLPAIRAVTIALQGLADALGFLADTAPTLTMLIVGGGALGLVWKTLAGTGKVVAAVLAKLGIQFGGLGAVLASVRGFFVGLVDGLGRIWAALRAGGGILAVAKLGFKSLLGPIGLLITAISLLYDAWNYFFGGEDEEKKAMAARKSSFDGLRQSISELGAAAQQAKGQIEVALSQSVAPVDMLIGSYKAANEQIKIALDERLGIIEQSAARELAAVEQSDRSEKEKIAERQRIFVEAEKAKVQAIDQAGSEMLAAWENTYGKAQALMEAAGAQDVAKTQEGVDAKIAIFAQLESGYKKTIDALIAEETRLLNAAKAADDQRLMFRMSVEDKLRALKQKSMTAEQQYADRVGQINEKIAKAQEAAAKGQGDLVKKYVDEAIGLAERNANEVVRTVEGKAGDTKEVIKSVEQAASESSGLIERAAKIQEGYLQSVADKATAGASEINTQMGAVEAKLDTVTSTLGELRTSVADGISLKITADAKDAEVAIANIKALVEANAIALKMQADMAEVSKSIADWEASPGNTDLAMKAVISQESLATSTEALRVAMEAVGLEAPVGLDYQPALNSMKQLVETLESTETDSKHDVTPDLKRVNAAFEKLNNTVTTSHHYIIEHRIPARASGGIVEKFAAGGQALRRFAGRVFGPGSSTSDSIPAMLSNGEFVIRASMVRKWGASFFEALNRGMMPPMPKYAMGGVVNIPIPMGGSSEALTVTFRAGDLEAPVKISDRTSRESMKAFARELQKIRLVQG